jgi:hypothetical protein
MYTKFSRPPPPPTRLGILLTLLKKSRSPVDETAAGVVSAISVLGNTACPVTTNFTAFYNPRAVVCFSFNLQSVQSHNVVVKRDNCSQGNLSVRLVSLSPEINVNCVCDTSQSLFTNSLPSHFYNFVCLFIPSFICLRSYQKVSYQSTSYKFQSEFVFRRSSFSLLEVTRSAAFSCPGPPVHPAVDGVSCPRDLRRYYGSSDCQPSALSRANAIWAPPGTHSVSTISSYRDWIELFKWR